MATIYWQRRIAVVAACWLVMGLSHWNGLSHEVAAQNSPAEPEAGESDRNGISPQDGNPTDEPRSRYDVELRDGIDGAAPVDMRLAKLLAQAESLLAEERWERAQEVLLFVLDRSEDAMIWQRTDGVSRPVPAAVAANQLLGELPESSLELYRRRYSPAAQRALAAAVESGDHAALHRIAVQFRHTEAGREAIRRIAAHHFDRAEFGLAAFRYRQLQEDLEPSVRVRAAFALAATGDDVGAEQLLGGLSDADRGKLRGGFDPRAFLANATQPMPSSHIEDWRHPQGSATGTGVAVSGEPVLLRRWSHPLTDRTTIQEQIDAAEQELRDENRATIPASIPLAIGDLAVSRTLRGLAVRSLETGRLLWETSSEDSSAWDSTLRRRGRAVGRRAIGGGAAVQFQVQGGQFGPNPSFQPGDLRPLSNFLYRDGVHGFLTSDGERVFAVGDLDGGPANRLLAYDLRTGRPAWPEYGALGGMLADGPFVPPLAGFTFFGPPVPAGDEAYVIGEKDKEIRLIAIDPATGSVRWNRLIAHAQAGIDQDPVRRDWPAMPAVSDGVLVCPTTVGWVIGIDRSSRTILWTHRYTEPQSNRRTVEANAAATPSQINHRWCPSAPILSNGRVLLTPAEETELICLDLYSGERIWQREKGRFLYVAGVAEDIVVAVGTSSIEGIDLETGATRWQCQIPQDAGLPSGRGVLAGRHLYLPLQGDSLWQVDLEDGTLHATQQRRPEGPSLGNLVLHRGTLLSYSTAGVTAFEERTELARQTTRQLQQEPGHVGALLRRAELKHCDGHSLAAVEILDRIDPHDVDPGRKADFQRLRWDVLESLVHSNSANARDALPRLEEIAETSEQRLTVRRLEADRASEDGDVDRAARAYLALLTDVSGDPVVSEDEGRRQVRLTEWLAGRFVDLWKSTQDEGRQTLDEFIVRVLETTQADEQRRRLITIFSFHPSAIELDRELAEKARAAGQLVAAEIPLLKQARHENAAIAIAAYEELAATAEQFGLTSDANAWRDQANLLIRQKTEQENEPENGAKTNAAEATPAEPKPTASSDEAEEAAPAENDPVDVPTPSRWDSWGDYHLSVVRAGGYTSSESAAELTPLGGRLPFYRERRLQLLAKKNQLAVSGPSGAGLHELIPVQSEARSPRHFTAHADGHLVFLNHGGTIQAISPVEGRVLWFESLSHRAGRYSRDNSPESMFPSAGLTARKSLVARSRLSESMPAASSSYVAIVNRGELIVRDPLTGAVRWSRNDLPREATIVGTDSHLFILAREVGRRTAYRAIDGRAVSVGQAAEILPQAVAVLGNRVLTVVAEDPPIRVFNLPIGRRTVVSLKEPRTGKATWTRAFPAETLFDVTIDGRLYALTPNGKLSEIVMETGETSSLGSIPDDALRKRSDSYLLVDADSVYVIINSGRTPSFFAADMPAVPVGGEIFAFDRRGGGLLWKREVRKQRLLCQAFDHLPILLLIDSDRRRKGGQGMWEVDLLALDKRTGNPVLDEAYYTTSTPFFHDLTVRPERRSIELTAYHTRLRLQARPADSERPPSNDAAGRTVE